MADDIKIIGSSKGNGEIIGSEGSMAGDKYRDPNKSKVNKGLGSDVSYDPKELEKAIGPEPSDLAGRAAWLKAKRKWLEDRQAAVEPPKEEAAEESGEGEPQAPGQGAGLAEIAAYNKAMKEYRAKKAGSAPKSPYP